MANITPRTNKDGSTSYLIRVFVDQKSSGKQIVKSMTFKPEKGMTQKQIDKKINELSIEFEKKVKYGLVAFDGNARFEDYAAKWLENAQIAPLTKETYSHLLKHINVAMGHIKLVNIQPNHLYSFYSNLKEDGIKSNGKYAISINLDKIMIESKIKREALAKLSGVSPTTISAAKKGNRISLDSANKIASTLDMKVSQVFQVYNKSTGLSDKTVLHCHRLISSILGSAKKERIIPYNVASEFTNAPRVKKKEAKYLDSDKARELVELLINETDIRVKTALTLALYSGLRRGELCGLSWHDIDFSNCIINVMKASQYQRKIGVVEVSTKNEATRAIKLPEFVFAILMDYKKWWLEQKIANGSKWDGKEERLFIKADGKPLHPDTINYWLDKFINKHSLEHFTPHNLRHTFSSLQIAAGVNLRTVQARTGHSSTGVSKLKQ